MKTTKPRRDSRRLPGVFATLLAVAALVAFAGCPRPQSAPDAPGHVHVEGENPPHGAPGHVHVEGENPPHGAPGHVHVEGENPPHGAPGHVHTEGENPPHGAPGHVHTEGENADRLALSELALANIGIAAGDAGTLVLQPSEYRKSFSFPGYVRYKPGRSLVGVPSPATGIVTKIYVEEGAALCPGQPLFELRLVGEELAAAQLELTALLRKRDRLASEEKRLADLEAGIAPREQREIALEKAENEAAIATQKDALRFFGLPEATIEEVVVAKRTLVTSLTVCVPTFSDDASSFDPASTARFEPPTHEHFAENPHFHQLEKTLVEKGESVEIGSPLCVVSDLRELWIEGRAFESDEPLVNAALAEGRPVSAIFVGASGTDASRETVGPLAFRSVANQLDANSRAFACYVELKNYLLDAAPHNCVTSDAGLHTHPHPNPETGVPHSHPHPEADAEHAHSHSENDATSTSEAAVAAPDANTESAATCDDAAPRLNWRFKPGQRCELAVETETLPNVFVVPVDATAQEASETFLFEYDGTSDGKRIWRKRPVRVLHQTASEVVVANDGSIKPGAKIANRGAYQLYVALTNGGGKLQAACDCGEH